MKLIVGFWTDGLIRTLDPSGPNVVYRLQVTRSRTFRFILCSRTYEVLFEKIGARVSE